MRRCNRRRRGRPSISSFPSALVGSPWLIGGRILRRLQRRFGPSGSSSKQQQQQPILALRLHLPQEVRSAIKSRKASIELLAELQAASDVQNQLAALRSYRSTVLHIISSRGDESIADDKVNDDEAVGIAASAATSTTGIIATYRILVELSLSADTPIAVSRAVRSSLEALRSGRQLIDRGTISAVHTEVANSILVLGRNGNGNATSTGTAVVVLFDVVGSYLYAVSGAQLRFTNLRGIDGVSEPC